MKKYFSAFAFAIAYAVFLSLGIECLLNLLGVSFGISLDSTVGIERFPRFIPFCIIIGILVLCILVVIFVLNLKVSRKYGYNKKIWWIQMVLAILISIPMIKLWEMLFEFLQNKF